MTDVPRAVRERLESLPHVVGTAIGKKRVDGRRTDETCLIVFVDHKIPETQLADHDRIPRTVDSATNASRRMSSRSATLPHRQSSIRSTVSPDAPVVTDQRRPASRLPIPR